jgi:predicted MFS family arabinose efflux permease
MQIATAIGVYYWTGFLGCSIIMCYQVWRMMYQRQHWNSDVTDYATVQRHLLYLIVGLGVGTVTLFMQALTPTLFVHTTCRFIQGFAGAFIFFYTALLNVALFTDRQQDVAVTFGSCALNVAEVFGSFLGAVLYDLWGQRSVFWFLGVVSIINQFILFAVMYAVTPQREPIAPTRLPLSRTNTPLPSDRRDRADSRLNTPLFESAPAVIILDADSGAGPSTPKEERVCGYIPAPQPGACEQLRHVFSNRPLICAVLLIAMSAVVKGSVEEMLPFHADHRWGYNPLQIGELFCTIAIAYIFAAAMCCNFWERMENFQVVFSAYWLLMLGVVAWIVFATVSYFKNAGALRAALAMYGICLGLTHTPANLLAAGVIDHEIGPAKDASNGIFQTMWEAGGSLGFLLGGLLAERYHEQMALLTSCAVCCVATALVMVSIWTWPEEGVAACIKKDSTQHQQPNYGSTTADPF